MSLLVTAQRSIRYRRDGLPARGQEPWVRALGRCVEQPDGCWTYTGHRTTNGYGHMRAGGKMRYAHRLVWESLHGPIPEGRVVCHTCDNPPCCNPDHLWLGSVADNNRDREAKGRTRGLIPGAGIAALCGRTHCKRGHEFTEQNTRTNALGHRRCRACDRIHEQNRLTRGAA